LCKTALMGGEPAPAPPNEVIGGLFSFSPPRAYDCGNPAGETSGLTYRSQGMVTPKYVPACESRYGQLAHLGKRPSWVQKLFVSNSQGVAEWA